MPINYADYPSNWKSEIRPAILERAGHKCEWCGVPDRYYRVGDDVVKPGSAELFTASEDYATGGAPKPVLIVLTIAHLHDKNPMNCDHRNLAALCQRCHLKHDAPDRIAKAAARREVDAPTLPF
jgi:hypothetical protein